MAVISIRASDEWLSAVDAECSRRKWKRNAAIVNLVWSALNGGVDLVSDRVSESVEGSGLSSSVRSDSCSECGGMRGCHQRWCSKG